MANFTSPGNRSGDIEKEIVLISSWMNGLSGFSGLSFNPQPLIQIVNHLLDLGFVDSLEILFSLVDEMTFSLQENVLLIARTLYLSTDENVSLPVLDLGLPDIEPPQNIAYFPKYPLLIYKDLPLLLVGGYIAGGEALPPSVYLEWCADHGRLQPKPLQPPSNPLSVTEGFYQSEPGREWLTGGGRRGMINLQVLRAVKPLIPITEAEERALMSAGSDSSLWQEQLDYEEKHTIVWDQGTNSYQLKPSE
jgi:hypothetical protein